jgi:hypothetical protein
MIGAVGSTIQPALTSLNPKYMGEKGEVNYGKLEST